MTAFEPAMGDPAALEPGTVAIEVSGVSKRFRKHSEPAKTLKERVLTLGSSTVEDFSALDGVDFDVMAGETFGILGHNGSGKSTLLKIIAGTIRPSDGIVRVRGRLSALLELGAGFHPDLTGRENVYLNGSILGFSRTRIEEIFDDIVNFAGLADFIDTQVKHYSSGMYARLGFAVAVNLEPDVLLIDEVLAVGDEAFQRKCIERVRGFQAAGRTICLVTHSPEQVRDLCDRAIVLDHGRMIHCGDVNEAVATYRRSLGDDSTRAPDDGDEEGPSSASTQLLGLTLSPPPDASRVTYLPGDPMTIGVHFSANPDRPLLARLILHRHDGMLMVNVTSADLGVAELRAVDGAGVASFVFDQFPFTDGHYLITVTLTDLAQTREYGRSDQKVRFEVFTGGPIHGPVPLDLRLESPERSSATA